MTKVVNKATNYEKEFYFDYSYWSHDGSVEDEDGYLRKDSPSSKYADQRSVYNDLGEEVLNNAWEGYHACLFAYGQTGSGKSYSMVGYGNNKGIIPIACEEIFKRITAAQGNHVEYKVAVGMLEIYNEQVQDLLAPPNLRVKGGLKIREHPNKGVYVEGLKQMEVNSYEEISDALDKGNKHRTVAATQMNATSSRAHTVLTISFTQIFYDEGTGKPLNRKQSDINLVDLAGSERASKTGATGDRLQEGSNINKSLSTLGKVITALAKKSGGQLGKNEVIPYRESKLTRILSNALGGNSRTTMIAAISPATFNFEETLSTLRYADAVKSIKNSAIVNETPQEKLIRELREENERLKAMLDGKASTNARPDSSGNIVIGNEEAISEDAKRLYEEQIQELLRAKAEAEKTWQQRLEEVEIKKVNTRHREKVTNVKAPHLSNLNEDPLLTGYIKHELKEGENRVGKKNPSNPPDITIEGLGIGLDHCKIIRNDDEFTIVPSSDLSMKTMVNGKIISSPVMLENMNRIRFGNHNYFLFIDPEEMTNEKFDWDYAVKEANEEQVKGIIGNQEEELKRKEEELKRKLQVEYEEAQRKIEEEKIKLSQMMKDRVNQDSASQKIMMEKEKELLAKQKAMEEELRKKEEAIKQAEANRIASDRLKKELTNAIQRINEANERAVLLGKNVSFQPELFRDVNAERSIGRGLQSTSIRVKVVYPEVSEDLQIKWPLDKLEERLVDMQEIFNQLGYGIDPSEIDIGYDPFGDNVEESMNTVQVIGHCYIYLDIIYYLMKLDEDMFPIIDDRGQSKGSLKIEIVPSIEPFNLEEYDNMKDIEGKELDLHVRIIEAIDIPEHLSTGVHCEYKLLDGDGPFKTEKIADTSTNPKFLYSKHHKMTITTPLAEEFLKHALTFSVYGDITEEKRQKEIMKLQENIDKNLRPPNSTFKHTMSILPDISVAEMTPDQENRRFSVVQSDNKLRPALSNAFDSRLIDTPMSQFDFPLDFDAKKSEIEEREKMLQRLAAEQQRKEEELRKRMEEIEAREKMMKDKVEAPVVKRGSCACSIF
jgi:hypothetical protein